MFVFVLLGLAVSCGCFYLVDEMLFHMKFENVYFINGMAYAGNFMVKALANKYNGIACKENYYDTFIETLNSTELPGLTYTRDGLLK